MEVAQLYQFTLYIVLCAMLVGVGVLALDKFGQTSGITASAQTSINAGRDAVATINSSWLGLIVTIGALAIIIALVIGSFMMKRAGR